MLAKMFCYSLTIKTFEAYGQDSMLRAAVERKLEIIGEALTQARSLHPQIRDRIDDEQRIVAFRNRVIHGYFEIDNDLVWSAAQVYLPPLLEQVREMLAKLELKEHAGEAEPAQ